MRNVVRDSLAVVVFLFIVSRAIAESPPADEGFSIGLGAEQAVIAIKPSSPLVTRTADRLADYLELRTGSRPKIVQGLPQGDKDGVVFVLALEADAAVRALAVLPDMANWRDDGYAIRTATQGKAKYVICAGKADTGIKYSVYRLMREMTTKGLTVTVPPLQVQADPFFRGRLACAGAAMAGGAPSLIQKHYAWQNWPISRAAALADYFDAVGMNGFMISDCPASYDWTGNHTSLEELALKQRALADRVHDNRMTLCFIMLGTSSNEARSLSTLQPRDPKQLQQILEYYDDMAEKYAAVTDLLWTQWADPGGAPSPADITDPQNLHLEIVKRFEKKRGRPVEAVFSAHGLHWPLGPGGTLPWAGYEGPQTLTGGGILPVNTCIGGVEMRLYPVELDIARQVRADGYRYGIFGWLVPDYEMNPGIHVHTHIMDNYFHSIPEDARDLVDWYEDGLVYTTMSSASFYVFSQMLWDPQSSAEQHLADYCRAAFGPDLAPLMLKGYRAIADIRCGTGIGADRGMCRLGGGSADPEADMKKCEEALVGLEGAYADNSHLPAIPLTAPAEAMINDLRAQIEGMATLARFRVESGKVGKVIAAGGSEEEIRKVMASLPKMEAWPGSPHAKTPGSWGQPEFGPYRDMINQWEKYIRQMADGAPKVTGPILFADDFAEYPAGSDGRPTWQPGSNSEQGQPTPQWMTRRQAMGVDIPGQGGNLANATGTLLVGDADWGNYSVQMQVKLVREAPEGGSIGLRVRVSGGDTPQSQSGYLVRMSSKKLEFGWLSGGSFKLLQAADLSLEPGSWHTLRVDCHSINHSIYLDGRLMLGTEDFYGPRKGRVALEISNAQGFFDDVEIKGFE